MDVKQPYVGAAAAAALLTLLTFLITTAIIISGGSTLQVKGPIEGIESDWNVEVPAKWKEGGGNVTGKQHPGGADTGSIKEGMESKNASESGAQSRGNVTKSEPLENLLMGIGSGGKEAGASAEFASKNVTSGVVQEGQSTDGKSNRRKHFSPLVLSAEEEEKQQAIDKRILGSARRHILKGGFSKDAKGKMAFLFLTQGPLPLAALWRKFLKGHKGEYVLHVHSSNSSFQYNSSTVAAREFYNTQIPSIPIRWGSVTIVTATRRLLATALRDKTVQRFILLSEACIPLHNFTYVQDYLFATNLSHLTSHRKNNPRYDRDMDPIIKGRQWRKGSQWFVLNRRHAEKVVMDDTYFNLFKERKFKIADEFYVQTLMAILEEEKYLNRRSLTYTHFAPDSWHPDEFNATDVTPGFIQFLQNRTHFDKEDRKDPSREGADLCTNGKKRASLCYLFARKFAPNSLQALLEASRIVGF